MHQHKPQNTQQHAKGAAKVTPKVDGHETVSLKVGEKDDVFKRQSDQVLQRLTKPEVQKKSAETIQKQEVTVQRKESHERQVRMGLRPAVQTKLTVNQPGDQHEQEADSMASKVMRMTDGEVQRSAEPEVKRKQAASPAIGDIQKMEQTGIQRRGEGVPEVNAETQAAIQSPSGGQKMPASVQHFMERRFKVDFSQVQIHNDGQAAVLNNRLGAKAFTYKNHIHFSRGAYQPETSAGKELLAHELTHVVQQGYAVKRKPEPTISRAPVKVQRLGISDALDYFADKAYLIPGYRMFCILLGVNPINMKAEERNAANILRAIVEFLPGGNLITRVLDKYGVFEKAGAWVEGQLNTLGISGASIKAAINKFLDSLSWRDIFHLGRVWERAKKIFTDPITRIITFVKNLFSAILEMIRQAVLMPLAALAQKTRAYDLLKAVLGKDPITGEAVPQTADNLIGGFMKLIGQEEIYKNLKKGKAVSRALAWFKTVLKGVVAFVAGLPGLIIKTLTSLTINDFLSLSALYDKVVKPFVNFVGDFISWGFAQVLELLKILFSVVAPGVMPYITKAQAAFSTILKNPVRFIGNLVKAGKLGFQKFANNILTHLKTALIKWLVGPLAEAGVYIPKSFTLLEIVKLVLSVLGLTWQNIRSKLVKIIPEPVLAGLEKTAGVLVTLVKDGPVAAWEQIKGELSELKDQLIAKITEMVSLEVVKAAVIKLASMLNPVGAVIQAIISIYNTIMFFVEKINQIAAVVGSFIDSIAAIASGQVEAAAKKVESTMANTLAIIIAFLAKFAGVGGIPTKLVGIVKKIRQPIDKGLDKIVGWVGGMLKKMGDGIKNTILLRFTKPKSFDAGGETHQTWISEEGDPQVASKAMPLGVRIGSWRRRVSSLPDSSKNIAISKIEAAAKINIDLRQAAKQALTARTNGDAKSVDKAQSSIDALQSALQPVLKELFILFGDTTTEKEAEDEAQMFALVETYDQVVVPLIKQKIIEGKPNTVSKRFRSQWNRKQIAQARGWILQMERILAAVRNVGTGRLPYLIGVEVKIPGTQLDYAIRDREVESKIDVNIAVEVKYWGEMRDRKAKSGKIITVESQIDSRISTLTNQVMSALRNPSYSVAIVEIRGYDKVPDLMRSSLADAFANFDVAAKTLKKRFTWRKV